MDRRIGGPLKKIYKVVTACPAQSVSLLALCVCLSFGVRMIMWGISANYNFFMLQTCYYSRLLKPTIGQPLVQIHSLFYYPSNSAHQGNTVCGNKMWEFCTKKTNLKKNIAHLV